MAHFCPSNPCPMCGPDRGLHTYSGGAAPAKGSSFLDAGYVYAPYVPLQVTELFDPEDFFLEDIEEDAAED